MLTSFIRRLWGDLHGAELKKFAYLSLGAFFLIGSYWPLKPIKDTIFGSMVGTSKHLQGNAKAISVIVVFLLVLLYSKVSEYVSKQKLIYIFVAIYASLGVGFLVFFMHPTIGVANTVASPDRWIAWLFYVYAESYVTLMVTMYWSFINDITNAESAKRGYGMIIAGSQLGGLVFSLVGKALIMDRSAYATRVPMIVGMSVTMFVLLAATVWTLTHTLPKDQLVGDGHKQKKTVGFFEGIRALFVHPYVIGVFGLIFFQEAITTLMGFQLNAAARSYFPLVGDYANFNFNYAVSLQILAVIFAFLGTSFLHRTLGTRGCLVAFPVLLFCAAGLYLFVPHLYTIAFFMLLIKALHYSVNQPVKETLYIPLSPDIKTKSKAWIDMIGQRVSKFAGSQFTKLVGSGSTTVAVVAMSGVALWSVVASAVGARNERAVRTGKSIE